MKAQTVLVSPGTTKIVSFVLLFVVALAITLSGAFFTVYAYLNDISFKVLNTNVAGFVFGLAVLYLGIRYLLSVMKFKDQLFNPEAKFSWSNFKREKKHSGKLAKSR